MKKILFFALLLAISQYSYCGLSDSVYIDLPAIPGTPPPGTHGNHKSPTHLLQLRVLYANHALHFKSPIDLGFIPYAIKDEDAIVVLSGTISIQQGLTTSISTASLPTGYYTIEIQVAGVIYTGRFIAENTLNTNSYH